MPYFQYEIPTEVNLAKSQYALEAIEKNEEHQFHSMLTKPKNRIIDLLDLFFPPRFKKKGRQPVLYPTLPSAYRKQALGFLLSGIKSNQIQLGFDCDANNIPGINELTTEHIVLLSVTGGLRAFKSYAVVDYDHEGKALVDGTTLLGSIVDSVAFVELLIECNILPLELLNFATLLDLYLRWNKKQLDRLGEKRKYRESWLLIDAISYASGFYAMRSEVSSTGYINGFSPEMLLSKKPLRWRQEVSENMTEWECFQRPKGLIDNGKLPEEITNRQEHWNKVFKNAQIAMEFGDIKHTGGKVINHIDTRVREDFFSWAEQWDNIDPPNLVNDSEQLLSRTAIKKNYTKLTHDMWNKALAKDPKLLKFKIPGKTAQKDRYDQVNIENWLIEKGHYTKAELKALAEPKNRYSFP
ncbi:MAG: hypothetical protein KIT56_00880 [Gammaproteobacteria bacterium]|nr:hypothetical protein [Gammaproteobacteria bacterium]MCW5582439.1 hypothetical protein [Gammaproteobacteria bacterium]